MCQRTCLLRPCQPVHHRPQVAPPVHEPFEPPRCPTPSAPAARGARATPCFAAGPRQQWCAPAIPLRSATRFWMHAPGLPVTIFLERWQFGHYVAVLPAETATAAGLAQFQDGYRKGNGPRLLLAPSRAEALFPGVRTWMVTAAFHPAARLLTPEALKALADPTRPQAVLGAVRAGAGAWRRRWTRLRCSSRNWRGCCRQMLIGAGESRITGWWACLCRGCAGLSGRGGVEPGAGGGGVAAAGRSAGCAADRVPAGRWRGGACGAFDRASGAGGGGRRGAAGADPLGMFHRRSAGEFAVRLRAAACTRRSSGWRPRAPACCCIWRRRGGGSGW